jgi:hypothetical protein
MINCPGEKDQVNIMMKGLFPVYFNRMLLAPIMNFDSCVTAAQGLRTPWKMERWRKVKEGLPPRKYMAKPAKPPPNPM